MFHAVLIDGVTCKYTVSVIDYDDMTVEIVPRAELEGYRALFPDRGFLLNTEYLCDSWHTDFRNNLVSIHVSEDTAWIRYNGMYLKFSYDEVSNTAYLNGVEFVRLGWLPVLFRWKYLYKRDGVIELYFESCARHGYVIRFFDDHVDLIILSRGIRTIPSDTFVSRAFRKRVEYLTSRQVFFQI